jgi:ribosomal protein L11 methyltransferase
LILENKATWLEVSLTVDGELAEAVAEVLSRFALNGVVIESTDVVYGEGDIEVQAEGPMRVYGYLPLDDQLEKTRNRLEQSLWYLGRIQPLPEPEFRAVQETDWSENWKRHYRPVSIGRRLVIVPEWLESPDENRLPIRINPGMAFGTGTHPTTQLCLGVIESLLTGSKMTDGSQWTLPDSGIPVQEWDVIDVGCGSGILSIAAIKLGARHAVGVDIDPGAIATARVNAKANLVRSLRRG